MARAVERRSGAIVLIALALVFLVGSAPRASADESSIYWAAVTAFTERDPSKAIAEMEGVREAELAGVLESTEKLAKAAKCGTCLAHEQFAALSLRAAFLLHGAVDRAARARNVDGGGQGCFNTPHAGAQKRILAILAQDPKNKPFVVRVSIAMSLMMRSLSCVGDGLEWVGLGLKVDSRSPLLHVIGGMLEEAMGSVTTQTLRQRQSSNVVANVSTLIYQEKRYHLTLAAKEYAKALSEDPGFTEARLRLGRVQWRLDRPAEARATLAQCIGSAEGALLYLAHLYLGQVLEDSKDIDGAIREYRLATVVSPGGQAGAIALAQALAEDGDFEQARDALKLISEPTGRRDSDPYWNYLLGTPSLAESMFEDLRKGVAQ